MKKDLFARLGTEAVPDRKVKIRERCIPKNICWLGEDSSSSLSTDRRFKSRMNVNAFDMLLVKLMMSLAAS